MERAIDPEECKNFGKDSCPNKDNGDLIKLKDLIKTAAGCYPELGGFMEKASAVCAGCGKFVQKKPNIILHP